MENKVYAEHMVLHKILDKKKRNSTQVFSVQLN